MTAKIKQNPSYPLSVKAFFWRITLTIFILATLAGPGAELLQKIVIQ